MVSYSRLSNKLLRFKLCFPIVLFGDTSEVALSFQLVTSGVFLMSGQISALRLRRCRRWGLPISLQSHGALTILATPQSTTEMVWTPPASCCRLVAGHLLCPIKWDADSGPGCSLWSAVAIMLYPPSHQEKSRGLLSSPSAVWVALHTRALLVSFTAFPLRECGW